MKSELCESCAHTNVCRKDKNIVGDVFVMGHPSFFDNDELFRKFKEREAVGFPCDDYMQERKRGKWTRKWDHRNGFDYAYEECSVCGAPVDVCGYDYCPNCGAEMELDG